MTPYIPIIIEEISGIKRKSEPVTVGIPLPKGLVNDLSGLSLYDSKAEIPVQSEILAIWPNGSIKWILLDFQVSVDPNTTKSLKLKCDQSPIKHHPDKPLFIRHTEEQLQVDTGTTLFFLDTDTYRLGGHILTKTREILGEFETKTILTGADGLGYEPHIQNIFLETIGPLRCTIKAEGFFAASGKPIDIRFLTRISFFSNNPSGRIEFTIHNPRAARHPNGLWDLGDPASFFFDDLSMQTTLPPNSGSAKIECKVFEDPVPMVHQPTNTCREPAFVKKGQQSLSHLLIYQDSSGGRNWKSTNHANHKGEVKTIFKGYRVYADGNILHKGQRANPIVAVTSGKTSITNAIQYFWQNFPKAIEADGTEVTVRLFPKYYNDLFELQPGERKTHVVFLNFSESKCPESTCLDWISHPIVARTTPRWYAESRATTFLMPSTKDPQPRLVNLLHTAISGPHSFFRRREFIDEYGWRNFGELYADHEAIGTQRSTPLISHYNNQYDCIWNFLAHFMMTGDSRWFILASQLCCHVRDIDIYYTNKDRPEFNHGLFWHTDHYLDAETATHRCFSKKHIQTKKVGAFGGGPSLSHIYTSGLLLNYYMTGCSFSKDAILKLANFGVNNLEMNNTLLNQLVKGFRKARFYLTKKRKTAELVAVEKVYDLDGPGRASGNLLNTLIDAYRLTNQHFYLRKAEELIRDCIHPQDSVAKRDLQDIENKWMYTIFLQSLAKYLHAKSQHGHYDHMWLYAAKSLVCYAEWIENNENLYLDTPEKLDYPNETWAVQDIRKTNVLLDASSYCSKRLSSRFFKKAELHFERSIGRFFEFETIHLTRPLMILMQNRLPYSYWKTYSMGANQTRSLLGRPNNLERNLTATNSLNRLVKKLLKFSLKKEIEFLKWRLNQR